MCAPRISPYFLSRMILTNPSVSPGGARAAVGAEGEPADLVVELLLLALLLGEADAGHLGMAVGRAGHVVVLDRRAGAARRCSSATMMPSRCPCAPASAGRRRRRWSRCPWPSSPSSRLILTKPRSVSWTPASLRPMASMFTARPAATSTFSASIVSFLPPASTSSVTLSAADLRLGDLGAGQHGDAALLEALGRRVGGLGVLERQDARQRLDQRDLGAEGVEDVGELAATAPAPTMAIVFGRLLEEQRLVRGDDGRLVELEADLRNALHARAGGDHDGLLRVCSRPCRPSTVRFLPRARRCP